MIKRLLGILVYFAAVLTLVMPAPAVTAQEDWQTITHPSGMFQLSIPSDWTVDASPPWSVANADNSIVLVMVTFNPAISLRELFDPSNLTELYGNSRHELSGDVRSLPLGDMESWYDTGTYTLESGTVRGTAVRAFRHPAGAANLAVVLFFNTDVPMSALDVSGNVVNSLTPL